MRLHLLRHAKSSWDDPSLSDAQRPLNRRGRRACRAVAEHIATERIAVELILCSSAVRTRETIEPILDALEPAPEVDYVDRLYGAGPDELLAIARSAPDRVGALMVVGHNPGIGSLAATLAGAAAGPSGIATKYPTGALASFEVGATSWTAIEPDGCELLAFVRPRELPEPHA